ncbi:MAG: hypothetical protein JRD92_05530 [Deltaproteobacteria bacterium]|nr:hypothetical protein [Deltaproteobacteria bacterium]
MRHWVVLMLFLFALGTLRVVACGEDPSCVDNEDCDDGNPCTSDYCYSYDPDAPLTCEVVQRCRHSQVTDGTSCGSGNVCADGVCGENLCKDVVCDDDNVCTDEACDYVDGTCEFTPVFCGDGDACTEATCDPVDGCDYTTPAEDGTICMTFEPAGVEAFGICEAGACAGPCDPASEEELPCPIEGFEGIFCCPGWEACLPDCIAAPP